MVVPPKHPKMIIFSRKTHGCWVPQTPKSCSQLLHKFYVTVFHGPLGPLEPRKGSNHQYFQPRRDLDL